MSVSEVSKPISVGWVTDLVTAAAEPYRKVGRFAWYFARGKLKADPAFVGLLQKGLIPDTAQVLDLGCGQGLLASWLLTARVFFDGGNWPCDWPPPPRPTMIRGIDLMAQDIMRARQALGDLAVFDQGNICHEQLGAADAVVILDVLHMIQWSEQDRLLMRIRNVLNPGGVLLLRVGDAAGGWRFYMSLGVDWLVTRMRGHRLRRLYCRSVVQWMAALQAFGFVVDALPMSAGTPFANVLLIARLP